MAWVTPPTYTVGQVLTAALMNNVSGNFNYLRSASAGYIATSESTASATYVDLTTPGPSISVSTDVQALVGVYAQFSNSASPGDAFMSVAVSGASTIAAADNIAVKQILITAGQTSRCGAVFLYTGLTAGTNTFKAQYRASTGTATFADRRLVVWPA